MRVPFVKTCVFDTLGSLAAVADLLPRGQWVSVEGRKGRLVGTLDSVAWVHWQDMGGTAADFSHTCRMFGRAVETRTVPALRSPVAAVSSRRATFAPFGRVWASLAFAWRSWIVGGEDETRGYALHNARRV